jgi:ankyrin repeat protein
LANSIGNKSLIGAFHGGNYCLSIHQAIDLDIQDVALILIDKLSEAALSVQDELGYTPLHKAIQRYSSKISLALIHKLSEKALTIQDHCGNTPLHEALYNEWNNKAISSALINKLSVVALKIQNHCGWTSLHVISNAPGLKQLVRSYQEWDEDESWRFRGREVKYYREMQAKQIEYIMSKLSDQDLTILDVDKRTPLHIAIEEESDGIKDDLFSALSRNREVLTIPDCRGETPLHYAIRGINLDIHLNLACTFIDILPLKNAGLTTILDTPGPSLLNYCIKYNNRNVFKKLIKKGVRPILIDHIQESENQAIPTLYEICIKRLGIDLISKDHPWIKEYLPNS